MVQTIVSGRVNVRPYAPGLLAISSYCSWGFSSADLRQPCPDDRLLASLAINHLEKLLDLGVLIEVMSWEGGPPHSSTRAHCSDLAANKPLTFGTNTIGRNDDVCLKSFILVSHHTSSLALFVLEIIDNALSELDIYSQPLNLCNEHLINKGSHLEGPWRRVGVKTSITQAISNFEWRNHVCAIVLERLDPCIMQ